MKNKKYKLHSADLQDFFVPINEIRSELYKVSAKNAEEAIHKLTSNTSKFSKVRSVHLIETSPNRVFSNKNINEHALLSKEIDHYQIHDKELKHFTMKLIK